jgi:UDP-N-acetyl-D-mannosaminuronate dehydrogenase
MPSIAELLERDCVVLIESTIPAETTIARRK